MPCSACSRRWESSSAINYTIYLKKRLGREGFKAYNANPWIRGLATAITFSYFAITLFFFANTFPEIREIFSILQ